METLNALDAALRQIATENREACFTARKSAPKTTPAQDAAEEARVEAMFAEFDGK